MRYGVKFPTNLMMMEEIVPRSVVIGGVPLRLRPIGPDDEAALRAGFEQLSPEARYARFRGVTTPSDAQWQYLTRVDGERHVAIVAVAPSGEIVGVARFVCGQEPGEAEVAFTIADRVQRMGLGHTLLDALLPLARARGVAHLTAYTSATNHGMLRLFLSRGGRHVSTHQGEAILTLPTARPGSDDAPAAPKSWRSGRWSLARIAARARASARLAWRRAVPRAA